MSFELCPNGMKTWQKNGQNSCDLSQGKRFQQTSGGWKSLSGVQEAKHSKEQRGQRGAQKNTGNDSGSLSGLWACSGSEKGQVTSEVFSFQPVFVIHLYSW